jgi:hypothetical protein
MIDNNNVELISPPGSIVLDNKTYLVSKPTERDIFTIFTNANKMARKLFNPIKETMDSIEGLNITDEQKLAILLQAHKVKSSGEIPLESISEYLMSPHGCQFYAWILIRKNHPEVTLEMLKKFITDENVIYIFAELDEASGVNLIHKSMENNDFFPVP